VETVLRQALWGDHVQQWELFSLMEDTWPRLGKALAEIKRASIGLDWRVEPWAEEDQPPTPEAEARARLVSRALWTMRPQQDEDANGFESTIFDIEDAWAKGISVLEVEWESRQAGSAGRMIAPRATHWVHPREYAWGRNGRLGLRIRADDGARVVPRDGSDLVPFPPDQFLIGICKSRTGPVLGGALLRPLAWWWSAANFSGSWLLNLSQIFGLPIRWANYPQGANEELINRICDMLENMGSAAWAAFPSGTTVELKDQQKTGGTSPQDSLLDRADRQVDLLVLGQTLTTDVGSSGSLALGGVHKSVRDQNVQALADWAAGVLNAQLVPAILRLNYGDESESPQICPKPIEQDDLKANAERDVLLLDRGVPLPMDWFYRRHQIPRPAEGEDVITKPVPPPPPMGGFPGGPGADQGEPKAEDPKDPDAKESESPTLPTDAARAIHAAKSRAQEKLADAVAEEVTSVEAGWLGGARPWFKRLVSAAEDPDVTDAQFLALVEKAREAVPQELGSTLRPEVVAEALEKSMGAAMVNGAITGHLRRRGAHNK
jgi:phage gp29-like protein